MASVSTRSWSEEVYRFALLLVVILFSLFLEQGELDAGLRSSILSLQRPAHQVMTQVQRTQQNLEKSFQILQFGGGRLAQQEFELAQRRVQQERIAQLEKDNQLLRRELGRVQEQDLHVYRFYGNGSEWFIDGGAVHGIRVGQSVQREGALVGVVSETYPHFSRVKTLFDKQWRVPVQIDNAGVRPRGVYDQSQGVGLIRLIPVSVPVEAGQAILTLGDAEVPPRLLLGWIAQAEPSGDETTWRIDVQLAFPPDQLEWVEIDAQEDGLPEVLPAGGQE